MISLRVDYIWKMLAATQFRIFSLPPIL